MVELTGLKQAKDTENREKGMENGEKTGKRKAVSFDMVSNLITLVQLHMTLKLPCRCLCLYLNLCLSLLSF
jgi:hypothetical protein